MAQRFDAEKLELQGEAIPVIEQVAQDFGNVRSHHRDFSVSENILAYVAGTLDMRLAWFDRSGQFLNQQGEIARYAHVDLSADDKYLATEIWDADARNSDIWVQDLARNVNRRLTFDPVSDLAPMWSPDGSELLFSSDRDVNGPYLNIYQNAPRRGQSDELLVKSETVKFATSISPRADWIVVTRYEPNRDSDIFLLQMPQKRWVPFLTTGFNEYAGQISPDAHWIAYVSDESGRPEVYIHSFAEPAQKFQISTKGGVQPRWRRDGKELFYIGADSKIYAVEIKIDGTLIDPGTPEPLFAVRVRSPGDRYDYAVTSDGQRFLVNTMVDSDSPPVQLVFNWPALLKR